MEIIDREELADHLSTLRTLLMQTQNPHPQTMDDIRDVMDAATTESGPLSPQCLAQAIIAINPVLWDCDQSRKFNRDSAELLDEVERLADYLMCTLAITLSRKILSPARPAPSAR